MTRSPASRSGRAAVLAVAVPAALAGSGCAAPGAGVADADPASGPLFAVTGFSGPESVRYDPDQDVYFVANFNGPGGDEDDNGFISRVLPDGTVEELRFIDGADAAVTLHAPRGMYIAGDTLWAADAGAVRGFDRRTGASLATIDFSRHDPGFLNDVVAGPDGALYVTDTRASRLFRVAGGEIEVILEGDLLDAPNGVTWDARNGHLVVLPFGGTRELLTWTPGTGEVGGIQVGVGGRYDGVEVLETGGLVLSSQADSTIIVLRDGFARSWRTAGAPADIGLDTRRGRVVVPYIALNRVDVWEIR